MSKNVIIAEGSTGRRMPNVEKILTLRPTTGSDLWVPVDERLSRQKYITKNGTFYATDEELYAFSKVTVNVPGGVQGVTTPTVTMPISNTSPDATPDINPITGQLNDITVAVETLDQTASPTAIPQSVGTAGNSITGIDPDTGNYYTVGVSPDGNITKEQLPVCIAVETPPSKRKYGSTDEAIDYSGMVVKAYTRFDTEGTVTQDSIEYWNHVGYKDGTIPTSELILPQTVGEVSSSAGMIVTNEAVKQYDWSKGSVPLFPMVIHGKKGDRDRYNHYAYQSSSASAVVVRNASNGNEFAFFSREPATVEEIATNTSTGDVGIVTYQTETSYTKNEKTVYYVTIYLNPFNFSVFGEYIPSSSQLASAGYTGSGRGIAPELLWILAYEAEIKTIRLPIGWVCPYNNVEYTAYVDIELDETLGSGTIQNSSSGGGGAGHSF